MKIKIITANSAYELEKLVNNFLKDTKTGALSNTLITKNLIDIKYQITKTDTKHPILYSGLIIYEEVS